MWSWLLGAAEVGHSLAKKLEEAVHDAGEEAADLAMRVWEQLEHLPFVPDPHIIPPITRQLYAHGAYMGAAPSMLADERWRRILAFLMPDVYTDVTAVLDDDAPCSSDIIPMFENNPVMAAFGVWRSTQAPRADKPWALHLVGMEWDLFIDSALARQWVDADAAARPGLLEQILDSAVIAHANALDTLQENLGFCQHADVRDTPKAKLGGVEISAWMDLFARALRLAQADEPGPLIVEMASTPRHQDGEACQRYTFQQRIPMREAVAAYRAVTGKPHFSVVMDMKSLASTPELFAALIQALNRHDIHVAAACSFLLGEIEGLSSTPQTIGDRVLPGPREVQFFHFAGDLQRACDSGKIPEGMSVLFNGACLLKVDGWLSTAPKYTIKQAVVADLGRYQRRHDLQIGLYVQEGDCDSAAAAKLGELVREHEDIFNLGFAWGGLRGEVALRPGEEPRMGHGSQRMLTMLGRGWRLPDDDED